MKCLLLPDLYRDFLSRAFVVGFGGQFLNGGFTIRPPRSLGFSRHCCAPVRVVPRLQHPRRAERFERPGVSEGAAHQAFARGAKPQLTAKGVNPRNRVQDMGPMAGLRVCFFASALSCYVWPSFRFQVRQSRPSTLRFAAWVIPWGRIDNVSVAVPGSFTSPQNTLFLSE